jgi:membrane protein implicated in regulation of membrane protease activity
VRDCRPVDFLSGWHLWLIAGLFLGALEIKLSGFVMLWFAVGAFVAALISGLGLGLTWQLAAFIVVSIGLFAASRTIFQKAFMANAPALKDGVEAMIGQGAVVTQELPSSGMGTVRINGELWSARAIDGPIPVGEEVQVDSIDGLKLRVRRAPAHPIAVQRRNEEK